MIDWTNWGTSNNESTDETADTTDGELDTRSGSDLGTRIGMPTRRQKVSHVGRAEYERPIAMHVVDDGKLFAVGYDAPNNEGTPVSDEWLSSDYWVENGR